MNTKTAKTGTRVGKPNYQDGILLEIIEQLLPTGAEGWKHVANRYYCVLDLVNPNQDFLSYHIRSGEKTVRSHKHIKTHFNNKLCEMNNQTKPTGRSGITRYIIDIYILIISYT
jgi:hypothetical protein